MVWEGKEMNGISVITARSVAIWRFWEDGVALREGWFHDDTLRRIAFLFCFTLGAWFIQGPRCN